MHFAREIRGSTFRGGSVVIQARLVDAADAPLDPAGVESAVYSIAEQPASGVGVEAGVAGHQAVALDPATVVQPTPTVSDGWDVDTVGYNFRHEIDTTSDPAFPFADREYVIRYTLMRGLEQPIVFSARIKVI